ncbi:MAG: hypothetical protein ACKVU1_02270 [bacterium]
MNLFEKLRGAPKEENRLQHLARAWDKMRGHVLATGSASTPEAEENFLALKREIGQELNALQVQFGSADLNREAGQAAARIRHFLAQAPTLKSLEIARDKDREGMEKAWHGVFLILAELSGAAQARPANGAQILGRSRASAQSAASAAMLGWPRAKASRSNPLLRIATTVGRWIVMLVLLGVILLLGYIIAEKLFLLGMPKQYISAIPGAEGFVARAGEFWQQTTQAVDAFAKQIAPGLYLPAAAYIRTHPANVEIGLFLFAAMLVCYMIFIRTR